MIQLIEFPVQDTILLDGNTTTIVVQSDNSGADYFFRAKIYIDDLLFDTQSWSRKDNFIAEKDLKYLYYSYFNNTFNNEFVNGLIPQTQLKKKVSIVIDEISIDTDLVVQSVTMPDFYLLYNYKPEVFNGTEPIQILGLDTNFFRLPSNGVIVIPFYANTNNQAVTVTTKTDADVILNTQTIAASTDKQILLYTYNLDTLTYNNLFVKTTITVGEATKTFIYKINRLPDYNVKQLVFKNNFGYYIPFYCYGQLEVASAYKTQTYTTFDDTEAIFAIDQDKNYKLNTNYLLDEEQPIVNQVALSLDTYLYYKNAYVPINTSIRSLKDYADKEHIYNNTLNFTFKTGLPINNNGFLSVPEVLDFAITGDENAVITITKAQFEAVYSNPVAISKIVFDTLPTSGVLKVVLLDTSVGAVTTATYYTWSDIDYFTFQSDGNDSGIPYADCLFRLTNGYQFSNQGTLTLNINDLPDINLPPVIYPDTDLVFAIIRAPSASGSYTVTEVSVIDPEGDTITLLWDFPNAPTGFSITNPTSINPTIVADPTAVAGTDYQVRLTATDTAGNSTQKVFLTNANNYASRIASTLDNTDGDVKTYTITVDNGVPSETIDLEFDYNVYSTAKHVAVFSEDPEAEKIVQLLNRKQTFTKTFDAQGEINFEIKIHDVGADFASLKIKQNRPTGNLIIDKSFETITL